MVPPGTPGRGPGKINFLGGMAVSAALAGRFDAVGPVDTCGRLGARASNEEHVRRIVRAAKNGDREAMRELYVSHAARVHACVARIVWDEHEAEDVTQQVFAKLLTELG